MGEIVLCKVKKGAAIKVRMRNLQMQVLQHPSNLTKLNENGQDHLQQRKPSLIDFESKLRLSAIVTAAP